MIENSYTAALSAAVLAPAAETPSAPTVTIATDQESYLAAAGGRVPADERRWRVTGDADLGRRLIAALGVTP